VVITRWTKKETEEETINRTDQIRAAAVAAAFGGHFSTTLLFD